VSEHELLELLEDYLKTMGLWEDFFYHKISAKGYDRDELPKPFNED